MLTSLLKCLTVCGAALALMGTSTAPPQLHVEQLSISDGEEVLPGAVWYPSTSSDSLRDGGSDSAPGLPLVVISHGGGGAFDGHEDIAEALARAGFVVAAISHLGDSIGDESRVMELWRRPRQLRRLVDYMLEDWHGRDGIDPMRIGAFGFSNGGFTVLVAAGGIPRLSSIVPYCRANSGHHLCRAIAQAGMDLASITDPPESVWVADERIKAVVAAAPAFGFAFDRAGLRQVRIPVQLWGGADDRRQPAPFYEDAVRAALPLTPEFHRVRGAGHYAFLPPCSAGLAARVPAICTDRPNFDRTAFHHRFNREIVDFFQRSLGAPRPAAGNRP